MLYEGTPDAPGSYTRQDLGLAMFLRQGKVSALILSPQRGGKLKELPRVDANSRNPFQLDLRGADLSALDLRSRAEDLFAAAVFDSRTVWPPRDRMPEGFDPRRLMEAGKNPGLGVRSLHQRGITGRGVAIALVDNPLAESHREYAGRLRLHERIGIRAAEPHFHGSVTLSIAAGETVGVAPGADLYFISCWAANEDGPDLTPRAKAFDRILEINRALPPGRKIRVISMSQGWMPHHRGAAEMDAAAAKRAKEEGLLVDHRRTSSRLTGSGFSARAARPWRTPMPSIPTSRPRCWRRRSRRPADLRAACWSPWITAPARAPMAPGRYIYFRQGGASWAMPYIAGLYALAAQVDPSITPDRFWELALKTGRTVRIERGGKPYSLGPIADPVALIAALKNP